MDLERWRQALEVFKASMGRDAEDRAAFVADACGGDEAIRQAVDELARADDAAGGFLEVPAALRFPAGR